MAWFADLAGRAENLLNNLDEQTGVALRNHSVVKSKKYVKNDVIHVPQESWMPKKRPTARIPKKNSVTADIKSNNLASSGKSMQVSPPNRQTRSLSKDAYDYSRPARKKSPVKKQNNQFTLNKCPKTLVGDIADSDLEECFDYKQRRHSMPADLELTNKHSMTYKMQNLEVENVMLRNELNVINSEVSELLDRLHRTEEGNSKYNGYSKELKLTKEKLGNTVTQNHSYNMEMDSQSKKLELLKQKIEELINIDITKHRERNNTLEIQIHKLKDQNEELEEKLKLFITKKTEYDSVNMKLETDLRHAQSTISDLQANLEKSRAECRMLEKDWEAYKLRVKGMLYAKDNEIKSLMQGEKVDENTKNLMEELERTKSERDELSEVVSALRKETAELRHRSDQFEARRDSVERANNALREAIREERAHRNRVEVQLLAMGKELKSCQLESSQTISDLKASLREAENELVALRNTSSVETPNSSALNVADYDVTQDALNKERVHYLTEMMVQKQAKIDALMADNNMMRIQMEKLECKYKTDVLASRAANHVVQLQDGGRARPAPWQRLSLRIGVALKRHPLLRVFVLIYMIGLHLWVMTVLFTSTPDGQLPRHSRS